MNQELKLPYLEYFTILLIEWHKDIIGSEKNDLSTLKVLKLLFFTSAVNTTRNSQHSLLDKVFDNFVAMPYGHVESDAYALIRQNNLINVKIDKSSSEIINNDKLSYESLEYSGLLKKSLADLKEINPNLIKASSFDLVDLSHSWYSWQLYYSKARKADLYSMPIPINEIKGEEKIYKV